MYHVITIYISLLYYDILIICYETMYFYDIFVTTLCLVFHLLQYNINNNVWPGNI